MKQFAIFKRIEVVVTAILYVLLIQFIPCSSQEEKGAIVGLQNNKPVISNVIAEPSNVVKPGQEVTIICNATDPDGDTLSYSWSFNDGKLQSTTGQVLKWIAPNTQGTFQIKVTVSDNKGGEEIQNVAVVVETKGAEQKETETELKKEPIPLSDDIDFKKYKTVCIFPFSSQNFSLATMATNSFLTNMQRLKLFKIVDRMQTDKILQELKLNLSGYTDIEKIKEAGKLLSVDAILIGSVFHYNSPANLFSTGSDIVMNISLIDIETGQVVFTGEHSTEGDIVMTGSIAELIRKGVVGVSKQLERKFKQSKKKKKTQ